MNCTQYTIGNFFAEHGVVKMHDGKEIKSTKELYEAVNWQFDWLLTMIEDAWIGCIHYKYNEYTDMFQMTYHQVDELDPYWIKNVNFSLLEPNSADWEEYKKQRIERGYDDTEVWNLDSTIIQFALPRIKTLKEIKHGWPGALSSPEEWDKILDKIILAFETYIKTDGWCTTECRSDTEEEKRNCRIFNEGWNLFKEWFFNLSD